MAIKTISEADQEILKRIQKRRDLAFEAWKDSREKQLEDLKFCDPENQWPEAERAKRRAQGRPCLTVPRIQTFIDQLVNDERQNRSEPRVHPVNDGASKETAKIIQGYMRHVEMQSSADFAYDRASESQKRCGIGFMRLVTDYIGPESFDQDMKILSVPNPFMYYLDPSSTEPDGSDSQWGFGEEDIALDDFKAQYPDANLTGMTSAEWHTVGTSVPGWLAADGKSCRVVEYYELVKTPGVLCRLESGRTAWKDSIPKGEKIAKNKDGEPNKRNSNKIQLKWYKVCANEILDRRDCPGPYIPIVPVYGKEMICDGKRDYHGVVRPLRDVQFMINVGKSNLMEAIGLAPKAPWLLAEGSVPQTDITWKTSNVTNYSALYYKSWDADHNQPFPQPIRNVQEPAIQAMSVALAQSEDDLKAVTGLYDPSMGENKSDQSGVAIKSLQRQGQTGNFHFTDNGNRSKKHLLRIMLSWIPEIVDGERLLRCIGIDGKSYQVQVNTSEPVKDPHTGLPAIYDLTAGKYDLSLETGPSYNTQREENADTLFNLAKMVPAVAQMGPDILVRQLDFPAADELADRICPPQFQKTEDGAPALPPQVKQAMAQAQQMIQGLTQQVHTLQDKIDSQQVQADARLQVAQLQEATKRMLAVVAIGEKGARAVLDHSINTLESQADRDHQMTMAQMNQPPAGAPEVQESPATPAGVSPAGETAGIGAPNA